MSVKPTIIVLVVAIIGVIAALMVARHDSQASASAAADELLLGADQLAAADVNVITLQRGDETWRFERRGTQWVQTRPFLHPMNAFSIHQLITTASEANVVKRIKSVGADDRVSAAALGFDPPGASVRYQWPGGDLLLEFGRRGVAGRSYVRVGGQQAVNVITGELYDRAVGFDTREWRDRTLFPGASAGADRLTIERGDIAIVLEREAKTWVMTQPAHTRLDPTARDSYFGALGRVQSGGFIQDQPDDLARFGLDTPVGKLTLEFPAASAEAAPVASGGKVTLFVGGLQGIGSNQRFAMIDGLPSVVSLSEPVLNFLFPHPHTFVDPTGSGVDPADVKAVIIRGPAGDFRFDRELVEWVEHETGAPVEAALVNALLEQLTQLRATAIEFAQYPHELEVATITFIGLGSRAIDTVRIARDHETGQLKMENGDNVLRVFDDSLSLALTPAEFGLQLDTQ